MISKHCVPKVVRVHRERLWISGISSEVNLFTPEGAGAQLQTLTVKEWSNYSYISYSLRNQTSISIQNLIVIYLLNLSSVSDYLNDQNVNKLAKNNCFGQVLQWKWAMNSSYRHWHIGQLSSWFGKLVIKEKVDC